MSETQTLLKIAGYTDTGLRREYNQDHIGFDQELGIAVLADGMGGHKAGEIAAHMAVKFVLDKLRKFVLQENSVSITGSQLLEFVSNTISSSNAEIYSAQEAEEAYKGMGTTIVATVVIGSQIYVGHVGDSRLYLYRNRTVQRLTKDHSLVQDLIDRGFYTEREARSASVGHVVTRALGTRPEVEVDANEEPLQAYDLLLLCSDGLTDMVSDWQIAEVIDENIADLEVAAKKLIALANHYGGKDNISVILMQT
ncbi:MAG: Stp1/IreP family PP2C-type Ser/Thr phosphatase [Gammaproteobacteria bacterium]|jgi:serine/threonine protein phosphatase PrpC|nr:Stp1/IreP family PP2C-type Ser/Thr phosphatase [Gammaproteobacteria bacterium]MBT6483008.1 Stp1/IreP family PP2C-type Ser/Thr phosphatase [Gammaproteobacteria bacterium]